MHSVDALLMGRKTYETVLSFGTWPYEGKPVYVLSNRLISLDSALPDTVRLMTGSIVSIAGQLHGRGHRKVYLDGGRTIQAFSRRAWRMS